MRCEKCNSPLINSEEYCKICGTKVEAETVEDFDAELEIIDFVDEEESTEDASSFNADIEIIDNSEIDTDEYEKDEPLSQTLIDIMMKPIVLEEEEEEIIEADEEPIIFKETPVLTKEPIEEVIDNDTRIGEKEIIKPETKGNKLKEKLKNFEDKKTPKKIKLAKLPNKKADLTILIFAVFLIISIILNIYLFISKGFESNDPSSTTTIIKTNTSLFNGHEVPIKNGWVILDDDKSLLLYDNSGDWNAFVSFVDNINYEDIKAKPDKITTAMKEAKYQFSSNFEKEVNNKKLYIFKGKKDSETSFLIFSKITKDTLSMTELKFKDEVNETTLDNIYDTISTIKISNNNNNNSTFEYSTLAGILNKILTEE